MYAYNVTFAMDVLLHTKSLSSPQARRHHSESTTLPPLPQLLLRHPTTERMRQPDNNCGDDAPKFLRLLSRCDVISVQLACAKRTATAIDGVAIETSDQLLPEQLPAMFLFLPILTSVAELPL